MEVITVWHGTNKQNWRKIIKSGKFKSGTWFAEDEKTARTYSLMVSRSERSAVLMMVLVDKDKLFYNGYYCAKQDLHYKDSIYQ